MPRRRNAILFSKVNQLTKQNRLLTKIVNTLNKNYNALNTKVDTNNIEINDKMSVSNTYGSVVSLNTSPNYNPTTATWHQSIINFAPQNNNGQNVACGPLAISGSTEYQLCVIGNIIDNSEMVDISSLYISKNYGQTWNVINNPNVSNAANTWIYSLAISNDAKYMTCSVRYCVTLCSNDYGNTWTTVQAPTTIINLPLSVSSDMKANLLEANQYSMAMSSSGTYQTSVSYASYNIYMSSDYGVTWNMYYDKVVATNGGLAAAIGGGLSSNAMTATGQTQVVTSYFTVNRNNTLFIPGGSMFISNNYGAVNSWSQIPDSALTNSSSTTDSNLNNQIWISIAMNASSGKYITALSTGTSTTKNLISNYNPIDLLYLGTSGYLYTSSDYGKTWTANITLGKQIWISVSMSSTGQYQSAVTQYNVVYTSSNFGITWLPCTNINNQLNSTAQIENIAVSSNGYNQSLAVFYCENNNIYTSGSIYYTNTSLAVQSNSLFI